MDWGTEWQRVGSQFVHFLPNLFGAILILVVGFLVAKLLEKATDWALEKLRFDDLMSRGGVAQALERTGTGLDPSSLLARVVFWAVLLITISMAANALNLVAVATVFDRLIAYVPNILAAILIVTIGSVLGNLARNVIVASAGDGGKALGAAARVGIVALTVFMALDQLGIAPNIVNTAFALLLGAAALAAALAFGIGSRDIAAEWMRKWTDRAQKKAQEIRSSSGDGDGKRVSFPVRETRPKI